MPGESVAKPPHRVYKILLVGDAGVGKSGLLLRFAEDDFMEKYNSTLGVEFKFRTVTLKGEQVKLQIWDTSGQERFRAITANYYRNIHGIMIVYDVTDKESFKNVNSWLAEINRNADDEVNKMVVGNKSDLPEKKVDRMEAEEYAAHLGCLYMETSAKADTNVDRAFFCIANEIHKRLGSEPIGDEEEDDLRLRTDTIRGRKRCC